MPSEVVLIFFVLGIWLSAIGFCLNQYKSLRRLETQVHYYGGRKDPLNIGDIKIVAREQDSIIYKKKRYSTVLDTHVNHNDLKNMHYVQQYLPRASSIAPAGIAALVLNRDDLVGSIPLSGTAAPSYNSSIPFLATTHLPLSTHDEVAEDQPTPPTLPTPSPLSMASFISFETDPHRTDDRMSYVDRTGKINSPKSSV